MRKEGDPQQDSPLTQGLPLPKHLVMKWVSDSDVSTKYFSIEGLSVGCLGESGSSMDLQGICMSPIYIYICIVSGLPVLSWKRATTNI